MSVPSVQVTKQDGKTGVAKPSNEGVLAIVAPAPSGNYDTPATYMRPSAVEADFGDGRLATFAAYTLGITKKPVVAVRPHASTAGAYASVTLTGTGTSVPTAGGTEPQYSASVAIKCIAGGTIGVAGITYQYSVDGGVTYSATQALGTANSIAIPNTGITIALGAGTLVAGDVITASTTAPQPQSTDLTATLNALATTKQPFEAVLIDTPFSSTIGSQLDAWLVAQEAKGRFILGFVNTRMRNSGETDSAYATALATVVASTTSIRYSVSADGGDSVDWKLGVNVPLPASLAIAARTMSQPIGVDPAEVDLGPLTNFNILDQRSNPKYHNEEDAPGLDALNLSTLRTFEGYSAGTYVTNARILSPAGSDYVFVQHARVMNKACGLAWQGLMQKLSKGVKKSTKVGPNGERYISEDDAQAIEGYVNAMLTQPLKGQVDSAQVVLHRDDDISSNQGAQIQADIEVVALAYIKGFTVRASFVKTLTVTI